MTIKTYPIPYADEFAAKMRQPLDKEKAADTIRITFFGIFVISIITLTIAGIYNLLTEVTIKYVVGAMIFSLIPIALLRKEVTKTNNTEVKRSLSNVEYIYLTPEKTGDKSGKNE